MITSRRTALRLGLGVAAAAAGCSAAGCSASGPTGPLRIAAGERGGFYVEFATLLADRVRARTGLAASVVPTGGSVHNLVMVRSGQAELGLALLDVAAAEAEPLRAIGRVYENYTQLVVPADSPVRTVSDLRGRPVSLGATGSGAAVLGARLLAVTGVAVEAQHHPLTVATGKLAAGEVDALLWSGGVPTPALLDLDARMPLRLLDLTEHLPALRAAHGSFYERVPVPDNGYGHGEPVVTVGVANLLVARTDLRHDVASAVAEVLVTDAPALVPSQALGTQYLDRRSLPVTGPLALHPGAVAAYRSLRG
ncbi:TAXI family TRAP transporter solute-binding subunit [Actinokineospora sp. 24-640]